MADSIFRNPIALNQAAHKSLRVSKVKNFKFAKDLNSVLVSGNEFKESAKHFPVVFVRDKNQDEIMSLAILGLRQQGNLFVNDEGTWQEGTYIPNFFKRYPFILADDQSEEGAYAVSIDSDYEGFDTEDGLALFDDEGKTTPELDKIVEFLKTYQSNFLLTQEFIKKLDELGLFKEFSADITLPAGEKLGFSGLMMIDEKALLKLEDEKALELFRRGFLAWVYAHLYSLTNFRHLAKLTVNQSKTETGEAAAE